MNLENNTTSYDASYNDIVIIIPARIGSTRLARKPLEIIGNKPMVCHVLDRALETGLKNVYVATDSEEISKVLPQDKVILTPSELNSGTDRVFSAYSKLNNKSSFKYVVNLQGDMPFINSRDILKLLDLIKSNKGEITTLVAKQTPSFAANPSHVKVVLDQNNNAIYFSRSPIPYSAEEYLCHIGIYGFNVETLEKFVALAPTLLETTEKLEQLRALYSGMKINVGVVQEIPISVDTKEDLELARALYQKSTNS